MDSGGLRVGSHGLHSKTSSQKTEPKQTGGQRSHSTSSFKLDDVIKDVSNF